MTKTLRSGERSDERYGSEPPIDMLDRSMIRGGAKANALEIIVALATLALVFGTQSVVMSCIGLAVVFVAWRSDRRVTRWRGWVHAQNLELVRLHMKQEKDGHNATDHVVAGCQCVAVTDLSGDEDGRLRMVTRSPCKRVTW